MVSRRELEYYGRMQMRIRRAGNLETILDIIFFIIVAVLSCFFLYSFIYSKIILDQVHIK